MSSNRVKDWTYNIEKKVKSFQQVDLAIRGKSKFTGTRQKTRK